MSQTKFYVGPDQRGSCVQAAIASVFELPEALAPPEREAYEWTALNYPGLQFVQWSCEPTSAPPVPLGHNGFWIAGVHTQTDGFTDDCGRCWEFEGNEHGPPLAGEGNERPCPFCGEQWGMRKGLRPGYHAIVMRNAVVEHDPMPNVDWDRPRVYVGASWWVVSDPSRITSRLLPSYAAIGAYPPDPPKP